MIKKTKKAIVVFVCGTMLFAQPVFAIENNEQGNIHYYKHQINEHIEKDKFDFVGAEGEELYFDLRNEYANGSFKKGLEFDIMTLDSQLKLSKKAYEQNDLLYDLFFVSGGIKYAIKSGKIAGKGAKQLNKAAGGFGRIFKGLKRL